jgi:cell division protein FtsW
MVTPNTSLEENSTNIYGVSLLTAAMLLTMLGLVMVYAASAMKGAQQFGDPFAFIKKQCLVAAAGFVFIWLSSKISDAQLNRAPLPLLVFALGLLALIFVPGVYKVGGGAARWINIAGIRFQPSELAKLALVFFLAKNLSRKNFCLDDFRRGLIPNLVVFGVLAVLMMRQPDFGSTVLMGLVMVSLLFVAGLNFRLMALCALSALVSVVIAVLVAPYRMARLTSFLDPWAEIKRGGFQIIQSYLAFQNGGLSGVGLGESKQKLFFLPEAHTDFILAVVGEETGFVGMSLMIALFALFVFSGLKIASQQKTHFHRYLALGLTLMIGLQASINMGVAMGALPTKGIPLPFISSGATSLMVSLIATGLLWRLSKNVAQN